MTNHCSGSGPTQPMPPTWASMLHILVSAELDCRTSKLRQGQHEPLQVHQVFSSPAAGARRRD